jgi:[ribosomal protein S5]-alanine N-acetyltransferase
MRIPRVGEDPMHLKGFHLRGPRVVMRPLRAEDFDAWSDVRIRSHDWLTKWEPMALPGHPDVARDHRAFASRCGIRDREWQLGTGYGFGLFINDHFAGEINMNNIMRGPLQNALVGYWIDEKQAGHGYVPEGLVLMFQFAFDDLGLHRLEIAIIPRNTPSRRVVEKLGLREEGTALRYLEINGNWEDHVRYGITAEDWFENRENYVANWLAP